MKKTFIVSLIMFCHSHHIFAKTTVFAEVVKIKGTVTKLVPGALEASKIEMGDKLVEDTSVLTGPKSFIKIKLVDKSEVSLGPESKIVLSQMPHETPGVISLLKGRIRAEVERPASGTTTDNKFYVRTRTAALGIRGTDFQTIYNPENRMTSLLTFKGAVAMVKVDEATHEKLEKTQDVDQKVVSRETKDATPTVQTIPGKALNEQDELKKVLSKGDVVIVPPGQNAFSSESLKKASLPVKISPVQLNALYRNRDFDEKNVVNLKSANAVDSARLEVTQAPQKAPIEGLYDAVSGDYAPKAGGYIDLKTGLYVAPGSDAVLDTARGVYRSDKGGDVDVDTGEYFAPKGLILDAKKGFVVDESLKEKPELLALREDLNKAIARDVVVGHIDEEAQLAAYNINEKFIRDRVSVTIGSGEEELLINEGKVGVFSLDTTAKDVTKVELLWDMAVSGRWSPFFQLGYRNVEFSDGLGIQQDSSSLFSTSGGMNYALHRNVDLRAQLQLVQSHFADQSSVTNYLLKRVVVTKLAVGSKGQVFKSGKFSLVAEGDLVMNFRKRYNNLVIKPGLGIDLKVMPTYVFSEKRSMGLGLSVKKEKNDTFNSFGENEIERSRTSLELLYSQNF